MPQVSVPAAFYRGGTSRAAVFREADLEAYHAAAQEAIILAALGSPDPYGREIDGLGGGISSLSKVAVVGPAPAGSDADVTFRFGQVDVERPVVEFLGTCGNISAAIGPFAIDEGMVEPREPITTVRVLSVNTGQRYLCHVPVRDGRAEVEGDYEIDGVPAPGARIALEYLEPGGSLGRGVLPSLRARERMDLADGRSVEASIVDAANPMVFVRAADLGATATELPEAIDRDVGLHATLEEIRAHAAVRLGLAADADEAHERARAIPKVVMVAPPTSYATTRGTTVPADRVDLVARMLSMGKAHRTMAGTAAICTAVAAAIDGTIVAAVTRPAAAAGGVVRIGHGAGTLDIGVAVERRAEGWHVHSVKTYRTARRIMDGRVYVPSRYVDGTAWYRASTGPVDARG
jgi:2-methylaconitate cis-trans-isomerase PrpF